MYADKAHYEGIMSDFVQIAKTTFAECDGITLDDEFEHRVDFIGCTVWLRSSMDSNVELRMRYNALGQLIISRICVGHPRTGVFSALFARLREAAKKYELQDIIIESAVTVAMQTWCISNNLRPVHPGGVALYNSYKEALT